MSIQRRCDTCDRKIEGKFWSFREVSKDVDKSYDICNCCMLKLIKKEKKDEQ